MQITTVGLDLAALMPSTRVEALLCARHCGDRSFCRFYQATAPLERHKRRAEYRIIRLES